MAAWAQVPRAASVQGSEFQGRVGFVAHVQGGVKLLPLPLECRLGVQTPHIADPGKCSRVYVWVSFI